jgi:hypothetical protein
MAAIHKNKTSLQQSRRRLRFRPGGLGLGTRSVRDATLSAWLKKMAAKVHG